VWDATKGSIWILCAETTLARKLMQNQGVLVQSHLELRASENARRETIPMRGLLRFPHLFDIAFAILAASPADFMDQGGLRSPDVFRRVLQGGYCTVVESRQILAAI
jgi:hypothetical protein